MSRSFKCPAKRFTSDSESELFGNNSVRKKRMRAETRSTLSIGSCVTIVLCADSRELVETAFNPLNHAINGHFIKQIIADVGDERAVGMVRAV